MRRLIAGILLLVAADRALAATHCADQGTFVAHTCPAGQTAQYKLAGSGCPWASSPTAAADGAIAAKCGGLTDRQYSTYAYVEGQGTVETVHNRGVDGYYINYNTNPDRGVFYWHNPNLTGNFCSTSEGMIGSEHSASFDVQCVTSEDPCTSKNGQKKLFQGTGTYDGTSNFCYQGCSYRPGVGGAFANWYSYQAWGTGSACTAGAGGTPTEKTDTTESCQTVNSRQVCQTPTEPNCIKIDGEKSCYSAAGEFCTDASCQQSKADFLKRLDESELAKPDTPTPPAADTGTPGQRATPDMTFTARGGTGSGASSDIGNPSVTVEYFSPTTAAASTTNQPEEPPDEGCTDDPATPQDECTGECTENPNTPEEECGQGNSLNGGQDCGSPPSCAGDPIECYIAKQEWTQACVYKTPTSADADGVMRDTAGKGTSITEGSLLPVHQTIDASSWLSGANLDGGSCISDFTINVDLPNYQKAVNVPMSHACNLVRLMRALILIGAMVLSFRIYMEGFA